MTWRSCPSSPSPPAWLLAKGITAPIASASTVEQLPSLMAAASLELTDDEVAALDLASQPFA